MKEFMMLFGIGCSILVAQENPKITTIDFVQIIGGNRVVAFYYYENNWKPLRAEAARKQYINSYHRIANSMTEERSSSAN